MVFVTEPWSRDYGGIDAVFADNCGNLLNLHQTNRGTAAMPPTRRPTAVPYRSRSALVPAASSAPGLGRRSEPDAT